MWTTSKKITCGAIAALAVAEIVARVELHDQLRRRSFPAIYQPNPESGYTYVPNSSGLLCNASFCRTVAINSAGLVGPDVAPQKPAGGVRIAYSGASNATGIWTDDGVSYVSLLATRLKKTFPAVEVVNLSVDGQARNVENVIAARTGALRFHPDILVLETHLPLISGGYTRSSYRGYVMSYAAGDPGAFQEATASIDWVEDHRTLRAAYGASYVFRALVHAYSVRATDRLAQRLETMENNRYMGRGTFVPLSVTESLRRLKALEADLAGGGTRLALLIDAKDIYARTAAAQAGLDVLDVSLPAGAGFHPANDGHLNHLGHAALADQLFVAVTSCLAARAANGP